MPSRRTLRVLMGLTLTGLLLGAFAGAAAVTALLFVIGIRHGRLELPLSWFGSVLGALVGGPIGALLFPVVTFTQWRHVPLGRLFTHLTVGTVVGGSAVALVMPTPAFVLLGGVIGFVVAGDRLATRTAVGMPPHTPRAPAG